MAAVWLLAINPAVAEKIAVVLPAATVTEAGTVNAAALLDSVTATPPAGAGAPSEAAHVDDPPGLRDAGAQLSALREGSGGGAGTTMPSRFPPGSAPNMLVTLIAELVAPDASVTLTTATTPFCITVVFMPASRQA